MWLGELIAALEKAPRDLVVEYGFSRPHSYRGYYDQLAFEPTKNVSVAAMLKDAAESLDKVFQGYKGGDFKMTYFTECWLANYGDCGEQITPSLLTFMLTGKYPATPWGEPEKGGEGG